MPDANPLITTLSSGLLHILIGWLAGSALGWLLMILSTIHAGVLPRWVGLAALSTLLISAFIPLDLHGPGGIVINLFLGAGPGLIGWGLWAEWGLDQEKKLASL